uniref:Uncharacterized protein n=1 Tax=Ixodes ricinus TaxID=34613 RepID=A0A6B0V315_IXORI
MLTGSFHLAGFFCTSSVVGSDGRVNDDLFFEGRLRNPVEGISVDLRALSHSEAPRVSDLAAQVEVQLSHQETVLRPRQTWSPASIWSCHIARAVEVAEVLVGTFLVARCELVWKNFSAHSVDGASEVAVGNGGVSSLNVPQWLTQPGHGGRRVEDNVRTIGSIHEPVERVVSSVADVDRYLSCQSNQRARREK